MITIKQSATDILVKSSLRHSSRTLPYKSHHPSTSFPDNLIFDSTTTLIWNPFSTPRASHYWSLSLLTTGAIMLLPAYTGGFRVAPSLFLITAEPQKRGRSSVLSKCAYGIRNFSLTPQSNLIRFICFATMHFFARFPHFFDVCWCFFSDLIAWVWNEVQGVKVSQIMYIFNIISKAPLQFNRLSFFDVFWQICSNLLFYIIFTSVPSTSLVFCLHKQ